MHVNTTLEASQNGSTIKIKADETFQREYEFDGCKLKSHADARWQRWFGSKGIHDIGTEPLFSFFLPRACKGVSRTVVEESQFHADDVNFIYKMLAYRKEMANGAYHGVWNSEGLAIFWRVNPNRAAVNVDVFLICLNGQPAKNLEGATDDAIKWSPNAQGQAMRDCTLEHKNVSRDTRQQYEAFWTQTEMMFQQRRELEAWLQARKEQKEKAEKESQEKKESEQKPIKTD